MVSLNLEVRLDELYAASNPVAERLRSCLIEQLATIVSASEVTLAVPMESRVKSLESIRDKLERRGKGGFTDLDDLIGIRLIPLFRDDVDRLDAVIRKTFRVVSAEDTASRLGDSTFGYQSNHYVIRLPSAWLRIPSYSDLGEQRAEIQVRTLSQHMWAAASHKLQYKREESVPLPLRRTISRVSALLETVDLEFGRVMSERETYVERASANGGDVLDVETVAAMLNDVFPAVNRKEVEPYDELLVDIVKLGIDTASQLKGVLETQQAVALEKDKARVKEILRDDLPSVSTPERQAAGVFFSHVGLARVALRQHFGKLPRDIKKKVAKSKAAKPAVRKPLAKKRPPKPA